MEELNEILQEEYNMKFKGDDEVLGLSFKFKTVDNNLSFKFTTSDSEIKLISNFLFLYNLSEEEYKDAYLKGEIAGFENAVKKLEKKYITVDGVYYPSEGNIGFSSVEVNVSEFEAYEGKYEATPKVSQQVVATAQKFMKQDFVVKAIPYYETTNNQNGITVSIASD